MLLFVHLAGCLCLSLAYSIYTFSAPPHPSRRLISNPVCPARRNPGFYFVLFFFFLADNNYRQGWPGLRAHPLQRHKHTCRHTHTRVERGRGIETGVGSGMRHALIFYYLFSISFSITLSAHFVCRSHAAYSFVLLFCSPIRSCLGGRQGRQSDWSSEHVARLERFAVCTYTGGQFNVYTLSLWC